MSVKRVCFPFITRPIASAVTVSRFIKTRSPGRLLPWLGVPMLAMTPAISQASSFFLLEQSPSHLGTAFSGTASNITDATAVFFNPAGISQLEGEHLTLAGNAVFTNAEFNNLDSNTGGPEGETDEIGFVPNFYYTGPINDRLTLGLGVNAPFGLSSDYGDQWQGRYLGTYSDLRVINANLTFAYEVTERLSLGAGLNYQKVDATLESNIDSTLGTNPAPTTDSFATIEGEDSKVNLDLSVYFQATERTSMGAVWRQGGDFTLNGSARFTPDESCAPGSGLPTGAICAGVLAGLEGDVTADMALPDTLTFSVSHMLTPEWTVHGDVAWTEWSTLQNVSIVNTGNGNKVDTLELEYSDTMRYALGATHSSNSPWTWRMGIAFDEAPQTNPGFVNPRIPDADRGWVSAGFNYAFSEQMSIDVGYAHLLVDDVDIEDLDAQTGHRVTGTFEPTVDIVGAQFNWRF